MELGPEQWAPSKNDETSFTFLAVEPQNEHERPRLSAGERKQIKSHLTLLQHKRTRQNKAAKLSGWLTSSLGRQKESIAEVKRSESVQILRRVRVPRVQRGHVVDERAKETDSAKVSLKWESSNTPVIWKLPSGVLEQSFSRGSMAFRTFALNDPDNVIGSSLSRLQFDISSVLHFYHAIVDFQAKDFAEQFNVKHSEAFESFMDTVLRDPIPLTTAILITVRHLVLMKGTTPNPKDLYYEEVMRGYLVRCVNTALSDPDRAVSDALLAAVGLLAIYEVKYGNLKEFHIHMQGLVQMVKLRGGIAEISQKSQFVGGFIIWQDKNSSAIANSDPYFGEMQSESCYKANPNMFTLTEIHSKHAAKRP